jgi:hypothetical protein
MAALLTTSVFIWFLILKKRKKGLIFMFFSLPLYFFKTDTIIETLIISYIFFHNILLIYTFSFIDKQFVSEGFFKVFSIPDIAPFLSKAIIIGTMMFIHFILFIVVSQGLTFKFILVAAIFYMLFITIKIWAFGKMSISRMACSALPLGFIGVTIWFFPTYGMLFMWLSLLSAIVFVLGYRKLKNAV